MVRKKPVTGGRPNVSSCERRGEERLGLEQRQRSDPLKSILVGNGLTPLSRTRSRGVFQGKYVSFGRYKMTTALGLERGWKKQTF